MNLLHQSLSASFSPESLPIPVHAIVGKTLLITGAGGSIGSALAHAISAHHPSHILLLDSSEQALYRIDRELPAPHTPILANVCDTSALDEVFELHHSHIVFHAAAYKHVPLMELHPFAALENNAVGTFTLAQAAIRHRCEQLILVSTDKAADPASIMGASKRIADLTALALNGSTTKIKSVRLCNVYASQGSVVPLFEEQITQGIAVTVTHPDATRYFLSAEQAAALLLFASTREFPSTVLVPDLGGPIRIEAIARSLIPQTDSQSQIVYTGLRPGEKLHETLLSATESFLDDSPTPLRAIHSDAISHFEAVHTIKELQSAIQERNLSQLLRAVTTLIPAYTPSESLLAQQAITECRP